MHKSSMYGYFSAFKCLFWQLHIPLGTDWSINKLKILKVFRNYLGGKEMVINERELFSKQNWKNMAIEAYNITSCAMCNVWFAIFTNR